jgi:hypothetical protein
MVEGPTGVCAEVLASLSMQLMQCLTATLTALCCNEELP